MSTFAIRYLPLDELPSGDDPHTLLAIHYESPVTTPSGRTVTVPIPFLGREPLVELWQVEQESVVREERDDTLLVATDDLLAIYLHIDETPERTLGETVRNAYTRLFQLIEGAGYLHPVRIWNAIPRINEEEEGLERYRRFCIGRADAFGVWQNEPPAASAIGATGRGVTMVAIAAKEPGEQIENPRQLSAYHYPPAYGPKSPLFSRATRTLWNGGSHLFLSGTASVIGHQTVHEGAITQQLEETIRNIETLATEADFLPGQINSLKVYLRYPNDLALVQTSLQSRYHHVPMLFLHADICRADLLIEIEATFIQERQE